MLEPIAPKGTRASDVREEALATQPIEYRLPIEHIRRTGPRRLTRGDSAVDAEAWLFAPGGVTSLPSEPMVRTPPPALTYVKEEKHKKHTKDTRDTGESTRDTFRETKDTTKEATKESPRVIKEKKAKRKSPKSGTKWLRFVGHYAKKAALTFSFSSSTTICIKKKSLNIFGAVSFADTGFQCEKMALFRDS